MRRTDAAFPLALLLLATPLLLQGGCSDPLARRTDAGMDDGIRCSGAEGDDDGDTIPNRIEGCTSGRDSDGDGAPDFLDLDADGDGVSDQIEAGPRAEAGHCTRTAAPRNSWPCDADGDGFPDFLDADSDGDGVDDAQEDTNADGVLGCCISLCGKPASSAQSQLCTLNAEGCAVGQSCKAGKCTPPVAFECSNGETDPLAQDTFSDGRYDFERGNFICRDATDQDPIGRKSVQLQKSLAENGDWHIALEPEAIYAELALTKPREKEAAALIDLTDAKAEVAGFLVSLPTTATDVQRALDEIMTTLEGRLPGGARTLAVRASGTQGRTHDRFESVRGTAIDLDVQAAISVTGMRDEVVAALLGRKPGDLGTLPAPYGALQSELVLRFVTVRRFAFKRDGGKVVLDEKGQPVEDPSDVGAQRLLIMGAIAGRDAYQDPARATGFLVDDLSNGTALATADDVVEDECDVDNVATLPVADIIWVADESGSMDDKREDVARNASDFFGRALASGLDFRMAVTGVLAPDGGYKQFLGKFCSHAPKNSPSDLGGDDRFLLPSEQRLFADCMRNPPAAEYGNEYGLVNALEGVRRHLPREANAPGRIRPDANLVIIIATDEVPNELLDILTVGSFGMCVLPSAEGAAVAKKLEPYLEAFKGVANPEMAATVHVIGGTCKNTCGADVAYGYSDLAEQLGGQVGDVCQKDLGATMQVIIDSIVGAASPVILEFVPISASLALAVDAKPLARSRVQGFDYRPERNSIAFMNEEVKKGSEVVSSYKRWTKQKILR